MIELILNNKYKVKKKVLTYFKILKVTLNKNLNLSRSLNNKIINT